MYTINVAHYYSIIINEIIISIVYILLYFLVNIGLLLRFYGVLEDVYKLIKVPIKMLKRCL